MSPVLRRSAAASFAFHVVVGAALLISIPSSTPPDMPEETAVTMEFDGPPASTQRAQAPAPTPSPQPAPAPTPEPPTPEPPTPEPPAPTPPPPPPPPQPPPPAPPPPTPAPATPPPPTAPTPAPTPAPPPPAAPPVPPPPAPPPPAPPPPRPAPPPPTPSPPAAPSTTSQPNATRNPAPDSRAAENTLERLRAQLASREPPRSQPSPPRGGAPGGGSPTGIANAALSDAEGRAIGDRLRECWTGDRAALDFDKQSVRLLITTDATGTVRIADVAPVDAGRVGSGVSRAFAERARRAALDPQCAQLPLPAKMRGTNQTFQITFRP